MGVAQDLIYTISCYISSKQLNDSIFKRMMSTESDILSKNHVRCSSMIKHYTTDNLQ